MFFMIILLYRDEFYEDVLNSLVETGINDSFVVEGQTINQAVNINIPIFSGLKYKLNDKDKYSKIIFSTVDSKEQVETLIKILKDIKIDPEKNDTLRIYLLNIDSVYGKSEDFKVE
ncbi:MAG: hypothetical protein QME48_00975 [bacterium]|uniref:Uncharacterized protein n=2 Tax=Bacteria candidate phyla TaxID=1783234 RepID=A0A101I287_UNCT6|nr:MAG: Uncharacterized protein XD76_0305 [candidate division TA06 bacterium 32_111]KUK87662.1 MAG: Uncharacterized protein XE03_0553 [candidate division TA06 bacterium 34_109]MDI6699796.1 hypothetical protein [bacterium]HAF07501.1 hypothetical protein [candidate division WOR-3 bacterium]HCP17570.1 hypothetical protein [candidate division WOR-3 bacterium]